MANCIIGIIIAWVIYPITEMLYKKLRGNFKSKPEKQITDLTEEEFRNELAKELGTEILDVEESRFCINYHGGVFWFNTDSESRRMSITFPGIIGLKYEEGARAYKAANYINSRTWWTVYIVPTSDEEMPLRADCDFSCMMQGSFRECVESLKKLLDHPFHIAREFNDLILDRKLKEDNEIHCIENDVLHKIFYDQYQRAQAEEQKNESTTIAEIHTIEWLLATSLDVDLGLAKRMRIIIDEEVETEYNTHKIISFNIKHFVINNLHRDNPTLIIDFENGTLLIHLNKAEDCDAKHLLYRMTVTRHCTADMSNSTFSFTTSLAISLTTDSEDDWEAKYMIGEGGVPDSIKDLNEEAKKNYYWGMKLYNSGNYLQALHHLKCVLKNIINPGDNKYEGVYCLLSFVIGSIYTKLNMPDTGHFYLETSANKVLDTKYFLEFAHCLSQLNTPDAVGQMLQMQAALFDRIEELEKEGDKDNEIVDFLQTRSRINRILVKELIKQKRYDNARSILNNMIENDNDILFAQAALNEIEREEAKDENNS